MTANDVVMLEGVYGISSNDIRECCDVGGLIELMDEKSLAFFFLLIFMVLRVAHDVQCD